MNYGALDTSILNGTASTDEDAILLGGIVSDWIIQGTFGIILTGGTGSSWTFPYSYISNNSGALNTYTFNGSSSICEDNTLLISYVSNGGIRQSETLSAGLSLIFVGGIISSYTLKANNVLSSVMFGGIASNFILKTNTLISDILVGGITSDWTFIYDDNVFNDYGMLNTGALNYISSTDKDDTLFVNCIINGGVASNYVFKANFLFNHNPDGDMLHNTLQLVITSATLILDINTPIGDS
jgi:hypothetical protein